MENLTKEELIAIGQIRLAKILELRRDHPAECKIVLYAIDEVITELHRRFSPKEPPKSL